MDEASRKDVRIVELERAVAALERRITELTGENAASGTTLAPANDRGLLTQLRWVVGEVPVALAVVDGNKHYLAVSRRWAVDHGVADSDLVGHSDRRTLLLPARWWNAHQRALAGEFVTATEDRWEEDDGSIRWLRWEVWPWKTCYGAVNAVFVFAEDITERKRAQEALEDADRRKDELLATLAHELRNPLAPIRSGLEVLRCSGPSTEAQARAHQVMERQLSHLVRLVDDLLDVARISRGIVEMRPRQLELRTIVEHAVETARPVMEAGGHTLTVHVPDAPVWVNGDLTRLAQVIGNLLDNAAKYTPAGGHIELRAAVEGGDAIVRITDDGIGIAADMLHRVFDLFARQDRNPSHPQGGLGIGLSLVRKLVEMHGGSIVAESPGGGRGSTFTVRLPLTSADVGVPSHGPLAPPVTASSRRLRVLVVDDNTDGAETLAMLLELLGHETMVANDGHAALEVAGSWQPALVFLDIGLPELDGYEVAKRLRADPANAGVRLAALTGWGSEDAKRRSKEAGFDLHLTKPVRPEEIAAVIASVPG